MNRNHMENAFFILPYVSAHLNPSILNKTSILDKICVPKVKKVVKNCQIRKSQILQSENLNFYFRSGTRCAGSYCIDMCLSIVSWMHHLCNCNILRFQDPASQNQDRLGVGVGSVRFIVKVERLAVKSCYPVPGQTYYSKSLC